MRWTPRAAKRIFIPPRAVKGLVVVHPSVDKTAQKERARARRLMDNYKLTIEMYDAMERFQCRVCYVCGLPEPVAGRRLSVDHNHETGEIRGLLCSRCNPILGKIERAFKRYGLHNLGVNFIKWLTSTRDYLCNQTVASRALGYRHFGYKGHVGTKTHRAHLKRLKRKGLVVAHPLRGE